jgi:hypothetical protein
VTDATTTDAAIEELAAKTEELAARTEEIVANFEKLFGLMQPRPHLTVVEGGDDDASA